MLNLLIRNIIWMVIFLLLQALIFSDIHLFNIITPMLFVYFVILQSRNFPRWGSLSLAFLLGILIDIFCNTSGITTASLTLVAYLQPYYLEAFTDRDTPVDFQPSLSTMPFASYLAYSLPLVFLFFLMEFAIEAFSWSNVLLWTEGMLGSFAITYALILAIEKFRSTM